MFWKFRGGRCPKSPLVTLLVLTLYFKVFKPPHKLHRFGAVCLFFLTQIRKNRCDSYKKRRPCVLSNISIVAISVGLPVAVKVLFSPAILDFNKSVQLKAFASKTATSAVIEGTPVMIYNFLLTVLSERDFRTFANWFTLSIFSSQQWERGAHKSISLGPQIC